MMKMPKMPAIPAPFYYSFIFWVCMVFEHSEIMKAVCALCANAWLIVHYVIKNKG